MYTFLKTAYPQNFEDGNEFDVACGDGWRDLILWAIQRMVAADPNLRVLQIKEKFGSLVISAESQNEDVWRVMEEAEALSVKVCESCGDPGELVPRRHVTLCVACQGVEGALS